jgi:regulator of replication initiation timing
MSDLTEIVDNLEDRIGKLLHKYEVIKQTQDSVEEELASVKKENLRLEEELRNSENRVQTLKSANAMLGSKDYKKETKLKINSLIREIDQCIVQLSE